MFRKITLAATALSIVSVAFATATPASAQRHNGGDYSRQYGYLDRGYRQDDRRIYNDDRLNYRGDRRSSRNRCDNSGGTLIGAIAGGLLGNSVAGRGDRTLGAVLGAGVGALAGRAIDRSDDPRYCRR